MPKPPPSSCPVCDVHAESVFRVEGMDCHEEVAILERRLGGLPGLEALRADVMAGRLTVTYDAARTSSSAIADAVADTGMRAWLEHEAPVRTADSARLSRQVLLLASGGAILLGWGLEWAGARDLVSAPVFAAGVATGGWYWGRRAWSAARLFSLDINVLMVMAVMGAMLIGEWSEAATVTFLFALAQWLESRNMERARHAIRALMDLAPAEATVRRDGHDRRVGVDDVTVGDVLVVKPGEKIPLDGRVVLGHSDVNQAPITGESMPVPKAPGVDVFAGTINGHGALEVAVTRLRRDTTLARIINLVEHAQTQRAPSQTFVERFAKIYTPAVVAAAMAVAVVPPLAAGEPFGPWFYRALVLLVISCPCALVISTPVAVVSALAAAARKGVLIKGGRHLETLGRVACLAFDKTGTLTRGVPDLRRVVALGAATEHEVLRVAAALEARSAHPIGRAILRRADREGLVVEPGERHEALPGLGVTAVVDGHPAVLGNHRLFEERGLCSDAVEAVMAELSANGDSVVLVAHRGAAIGVMAVADAPRDKARESVRLLREGGVAHIVMLTGDQAGTAASVAADIGITEVRAGLLPEHKVDAVTALKQAYGTVAMVGDGVNDAPALAAADIGIAMGAAGTDAALETADVALMADDLLRIPYAIRLSRATVRTIQVNVALSLGLKAVFLVLAGLGWATLWMAVVADMGASLLVIVNGMRLLRHE
ncbi:MAG: heavy metal translocating P-type ATPase [Vicinamibacterales bacterium]|nr:heavy metal translocating P-type ATPase [Vicinamibacterales bacterium]